MRKLHLVLLSGFGVLAGCQHAPPPAPPTPPTDASRVAALRWLNSNALPLSTLDSTASPSARAAFLSIVGDARVLGMSEYSEGTHEFGELMRNVLRDVVEGAGFRGIAVQAAMPEALEVDRYVRTGVGDPRRLLRALGPGKWDRQEVVELVSWMRAYNTGKPAAQQIGFYGIDLTNVSHAVRTVETLPATTTGTALQSWIRNEYQCVAQGAAAYWGLEGYAADTTYWERCATVTARVRDTLGAIRKRSSTDTADVAFAQQMAALVQRSVTQGIRHVKRADALADNIVWTADQLGPDARIVFWGRDAEGGRQEMERGIVQTGMVLGQRLGEKYRPVAFAFGNGSIHAQGVDERTGQPSGYGNVRAAPPEPGSYEELLQFVNARDFYVDMRKVTSDSSAKWLVGPHPMRFIGSQFVATAARQFTWPTEFPKHYDALMFVRDVSPAK